MKHIIIGTAGHIDHGKTTLIKALTGRNTDRWEEEKRRGITIDLGFTWFDLPSGLRAGIIDVPGHERFINNMVAGVVGMDMVLLVVAADEGIMPQTREHIDILRLLGVENCVVALNKCDMVDEDWIDMVEEDIREELEDTFVKEAPVVRISAVSGQGLDALVTVIEETLENKVTQRDIDTIPKLPIDRVFTLSGFGTVITGTLVSGIIRKEDTLEVYPIEKTCKIRSIQVHGEDMKACYAGQRVAINISNLKKEELYRGCLLAPPGSMKKSDLLDVRLENLKTSRRTIVNNSRLHLYTGTNEILCRAILLDQKELTPGDQGLVQLRLEKAVALSRGDRFVVRFYSPMETVGGGVIIEPNPGFKKRFRKEALEELRMKEQGSSADIMEIHIKKHEDTLISLTELARISAVSLEEVSGDICLLKDQGRVRAYELRKDIYVWHAESRRKYQEALVEELTAYQNKYPYRYGMKKAEVQGSLFRGIKSLISDKILEEFQTESIVKREGEYLFTPEHRILKDDLYRKLEGIILRSISDAGYDFLRFQEIDLPKDKGDVADDIINVLMAEGRVVKVSDDLYTLKEKMDEAREIITNRLREDPVITIAQVRDMFHTSRKSAKPILEYMDSIKVTKKTGAESERVAY